MADKDYGHSPEVEEMLAELEQALAADQAQRKAGMAATVGASRQMKEKEMLDKVERASREATQRMQAQQAVYPELKQPGEQMPPPGAMAMAPPVTAQPMPSQPMPQVPPTQMPRPQPMAMAPPIQGQPMPVPPGPPAQPLPPQGPPAQPQMTPEQWAMLQQQIYGA